MGKNQNWGFWGILSGRRPTRGRAGAVVRTVDMPRLTGGVLHTKFWLVDSTHLYVGSANMDWRSLTQVSSVAAPSYGAEPVPNGTGAIPEPASPPPSRDTLCHKVGLERDGGTVRWCESATVLLTAGEGAWRRCIQLQLLGQRFRQNF